MQWALLFALSTALGAFATLDPGQLLDTYLAHRGIRVQSTDEPPTHFPTPVSFHGSPRPTPEFLIQCVRENHHNCVVWALDEGVDVGAHDNLALLASVLLNNTRIAELLVKHGADACARDGEIYRIAMMQGNCMLGVLLTNAPMCPPAIGLNRDMSEVLPFLNQPSEAPPFRKKASRKLFHPDAVESSEFSDRTDFIKRILDSLRPSVGDKRAPAVALMNRLEDALIDCDVSGVASALNDGANVAYVSLNAMSVLVAKQCYDVIDLFVARRASHKVMDVLVFKMALLRRSTLHLELARLAGYDLHADNEAALRTAAQYGLSDMVEALLKHGADIHVKNDEAIRVAFFSQHFKTVRVLIRHGADLNALKVSPTTSLFPLFKVLYAAETQSELDNELRSALLNCSSELVEFLCLNGARLSSVSASDLEAMVMELQCFEMTDVLVDRKMHHEALPAMYLISALLRDNVDRFHDAKRLNPFAPNEVTLRAAAKAGSNQVLRYLILHGADVHANNNEALFYAAYFGHLKTVRILLESGADVTANDYAAFKAAIQRRHGAIVGLMELWTRR